MQPQLSSELHQHHAYLEHQALQHAARSTQPTHYAAEVHLVHQTRSGHHCAVCIRYAVATNPAVARSFAAAGAVQPCLKILADPERELPHQEQALKALSAM